MSGDTKIEWATKVWNPTTGCDQVSEGCDHCYAKTIAGRLWPHQYEPNADGSSRRFEDVRLHPERLEDPFRWRKPQRVFVDSMSDLFHKDVPLDFLAKVWNVMVDTPQHTYMILTKRPGRMRSALGPRGIGFYAVEGPVPFPQPNIWLGTSVENQKWAKVRVPLLLETPAAVRFLSCEPLLGLVYLADMRWGGGERRDEEGVLRWGSLNALAGMGQLNGDDRRINWVIAGGESGPGARPMHPDWARSLRDQCVDAGVPFFFKQWGSWAPGAHFDGRRAQWVDLDGHARPWEDALPAPGGTVMHWCGQGPSSGGRTLDERTWDERPEVAA